MRSLKPGESFAWEVQIRENKTLTDPSSNAVYIQFYDADDNAMLGASVTCTRRDTGQYYYAYDVPTTANSGIWKVEFEYTMTGDSAATVETFSFDVYARDAVDTEDTPALNVSSVRAKLGLTKDQSVIDDSTIAIQITTAGKYIDMIKSVDANSATVQYTKFLRACLLTLGIVSRLSKGDIYDGQTRILSAEYRDFEKFIRRVQDTSWPDDAFFKAGGSVSKRRFIKK